MKSKSAEFTTSSSFDRPFQALSRWTTCSKKSQTYYQYIWTADYLVPYILGKEPELSEFIFVYVSFNSKTFYSVFNGSQSRTRKLSMCRSNLSYYDIDDDPEFVPSQSELCLLDYYMISKLVLDYWYSPVLKLFLRSSNLSGIATLWSLCDVNHSLRLVVTPSQFNNVWWTHWLGY